MNDEAFARCLDRVEEIVPRYAIEGPRYTSYPTAPVWTESYGPEQMRAELGRGDMDPEEGLSLYLHVPFCDSLCHYCACNRVVTTDPALPARYLELIEREVAAVREALRVPRTATQQHWGGGTPTHLTPEQVRRLFHSVTAAFPLAEGAEISIEVDPRVTSEEHVAALRECGFNRFKALLKGFKIHEKQANRITQQGMEMLDPVCMQHSFYHQRGLRGRPAPPERAFKTPVFESEKHRILCR